MITSSYNTNATHGYTGTSGNIIYVTPAKKKRAEKQYFVVDDTKVYPDVDYSLNQVKLYKDNNGIWYKLKIKATHDPLTGFITLEASPDKSTWLLLKEGNPFRDFSIQLYKSAIQVPPKNIFKTIITHYEKVLNELSK